jgi:hypothetical protein
MMEDLLPGTVLLQVGSVGPPANPPSFRATGRDVARLGRSSELEP